MKLPIISNLHELHVLYFQGGIYVYDGIPSFMNDIGVMSSVSLGVFCETTAPITVQAHSGVITLYTEHRMMQQQYCTNFNNCVIYSR